WDQSQNSIIVNSNILGKIVLGRTALGTGGADMDNDPALATTYLTDYFILIVGSNGTNELYTMEFNIGIINTSSGYGFRIVYQTSSGAGDGHLSQYNSVAAITPTPPQCKTRSSLSASTLSSDHPALMAYPISIELNF